MAISSEARDQLAARFEVLLPHLNERQQRLALAEPLKADKNRWACPGCHK